MGVQDASRTCSGVADEELARHPKVHHEHGTVVEVHEEVFASTAGGDEGATGEVGWRTRRSTGAGSSFARSPRHDPRRSADQRGCRVPFGASRPRAAQAWGGTGIRSSGVDSSGMGQRVGAESLQRLMGGVVIAAWRSASFFERAFALRPDDIA